MLYTVASRDWSPGSPLLPRAARGALFRSRAEVEAIAEGRPTLAVALRYDAARGVVVPQGPVAQARAGGWSAPAVVDGQGGVTVLGAIPETLVRMVGPAELRAHPAPLRVFPRPHLAAGTSSRRGSDAPTSEQPRSFWRTRFSLRLAGRSSGPGPPAREGRESA